MNKLRKQVAYFFLATLVANTAIFLASTSFPSLRLSSTNTYVSPKDCFATGIQLINTINQCTNTINNELATLKNEMNKLRKQVAYFFLATLVANTAIFLASTSFPSLRLSSTNTYVSPKDCFATGRGLEMAVVGERANAVLNIVDTSGKEYALQQETVVCELKSESNGEKIDCIVKKMENQLWSDTSVCHFLHTFSQ